MRKTSLKEIQRFSDWITQSLKVNTSNRGKDDPICFGMGFYKTYFVPGSKKEQHVELQDKTGYARKGQRNATRNSFING